MLVYFSQSRMTVTERVVNSTIYIPIIHEGKTNLPEDQSIKVFYEIKLYTNDTANELDYEEIENNVTFKNLQHNASAGLIILSDSISESDETLHVELMQRSDYVLGSPSIVTIVIKDDSFVGILPPQDGPSCITTLNSLSLAILDTILMFNIDKLQ